jgi:hypothetical protein
MSGFQDTFTRNKQEEELQYDDTAAYFFFASILAIILVPFTIHLIFYYFKKPTFDQSRVIDKKRLELNLKEFNRRKYTGFYYCKVHSSPFPLLPRPSNPRFSSPSSCSTYSPSASPREAI